MSGEQERPNRTVNDFNSADDLLQALKSKKVKRSNDDDQYASFMNPAMREQQAGALAVLIEGQEDASIGSTSSAGGAETFDPNLDWVLENCDEETTQPQSLREELRRLMVLKSYLMLDSERKEAFERVTGLASRIFKCPMALISLVDLGRQWFMSNRGLGETRETDRKSAFCAHCIMGKDNFLMVKDALDDPRFKNNPLVLGPPHIRFYAGTPLMSPEGYKLGTLCVLDREPRPNGLTLDEKQNLMELAALAVQAAVDHKRQKLEGLVDPVQLIAYTAHDLLTPLTGVQLSLSLLTEDEHFRKNLTAQQAEIITTASNCTDVMARICNSALDSYRKNQRGGDRGDRNEVYPTRALQKSKPPVVISDFVKSLYMVLDPFPKKVPLIITVHPSVPELVITDDLKVFRAAVNYLTNACAKTETGTVHLTISTTREHNRSMLLFECEDTGTGVPVENYPNLFLPFDDEDETVEETCIRPDGGFDAVSQARLPSSGLGLYSVAVHISSLGGEYGYRPRGGENGSKANNKPVSGSIFWFKIPLVVPDGSSKDDNGISNETTSLIHSFTNLQSSLQDLKGDFQFGSDGLVRVLSTNSISETQAAQVHNAFTNVLEGGSLGDSGNIVPGMDIDDRTSETATRVSVVQPMKEAVPIPFDSRRQRRALVIEDSMVVRKSLTRVLTRLGFATVQAVDGMEGIRELKSTLFDLVLCDFLMPVMDGLDCVQQYREWEREHRPFFQQYIIGMSAHASDGDVARGLEIGMDDFKPKPVTYKQLAEVEKSMEVTRIGKNLDKLGAAGTLMVDVRVHDQANHSTESESVCCEPPSTGKASTCTGRFCLIAVGQGVTDTVSMEKFAKAQGWKMVVVHNGEDALRLMKMRNWDVVLLDDELPDLACAQVVTRFREWEDRNRVHRQGCIALLSANSVAAATGSKSMVQLPFGFDASLGKPILVKELEYMLSKAEKSEIGAADIVMR